PTVARASGMTPCSTALLRGLRLAHVRAAPKARGVIVVRVFVRDGSVSAPLAVLVGVEPEPTLERAVRVGGPLVQIADHVVNTVVVDATGERARLCHGSVQLIQARVV